MCEIYFMYKKKGLGTYLFFILNLKSWYTPDHYALNLLVMAEDIAQEQLQ